MRVDHRRTEKREINEKVYFYWSKFAGSYGNMKVLTENPDRVGGGTRS